MEVRGLRRSWDTLVISSSLLRCCLFSLSSFSRSWTDISLMTAHSRVISSSHYILINGIVIAGTVFVIFLVYRRLSSSYQKRLTAYFFWISWDRYSTYLTLRLILTEKETIKHITVSATATTDGRYSAAMRYL